MQCWISQLRGITTASEKDYDFSVTMMNFTAKPEHQWQFILAAIPYASDEELGAIAAGPMEHLLGWHGPNYIDKVEQQAQSDPKFARMLKGVWKYLMKDDVWKRVQALQAHSVRRKTSRKRALKNRRTKSGDLD